MKMTYLYDSLDRAKEVRYPAQYGISGSPRKIIEPTYDTASRLSSLKVNGVVQAGDIVYNSSDQTESIKIGTATMNQVTEKYTYDSLSGLLTNQKVIKNYQASNQQTLLDLSYVYARNNSVGTGTGKTGHLTKTTDNLNSNKNKEYEFDALGRLTKAKGGNNLWTQTYTYDRFGNRTNVAATGNGINGQPMQKDGTPNLTYDNLTNRITNSGVNYDAAGNQTRALAEDGVTWLKYEYDAANRLQIIKKDDGSPNGISWQAFQYGSTNQRLMDYDYLNGTFKIFGSGGSIEYTEYASAVMTWTKSYTYLGDSILSTTTPNVSGGETTEFNHPDRLGTRIVTNQTAGTSTEQASLPFGTALGSETSRAESKRFTSYDRSARTGLDYAVNRTYDSKLGRFTQVDPIKMSSVSLDSPQTLNLYAYCGNDPINHTDSNGLFFGFLKKLFNAINKILLWVVVVIAIVLLVAFVVYTAGGAMPAFLGDGIGWLIGLVGKIGALTSSFMATAVGIEVGNAVGFSIASGLYGVGAVVSALQGDDKKKTKRKKKKEKSKSVWCPKNAVQAFFSNYRQQGKIYEEALKQSEDTRKEAGGWIYQSSKGKVEAVLKPDGGSSMSINLWKPPVRKGMRVVGTFHVHRGRLNADNADASPSGGEEIVGNVLYSNGDYAVNRDQQVPGLLLTRPKSGGIRTQIYGPNSGVFGIGVPNGCPK
jgi:RHS repeat-associated protein